HYDDVLVYGSREVFDLGAQYDWPDDVKSLVHYCGYVCAPPGSATAKPLRRRLLRDAPDGRLVLAMAGGGADAHALFETLLRALPRIRADQPCAVTIVTGPFVSASSWSTLKRLSRGLPVRLIRSVGATLPYLSAADLVVAMAGYNTTAEILGSGIRALLVPRKGPSAEQQMRASRFADRGWVHWLPPSTLAEETLADAVLAALESPRPKPAVPPDLDGARRAVQHLLSDMSEPAAESLAREVVR
ncbi:MAG: glycosyltransferase family protein, partial [Nocardioidaceae bacterium]